jgi:hypothetical protein
VAHEETVMQVDSSKKSGIFFFFFFLGPIFFFVNRHAQHHKDHKQDHKILDNNKTIKRHSQGLFNPV